MQQTPVPSPMQPRRAQARAQTQLRVLALTGYIFGRVNVSMAWMRVISARFQDTNEHPGPTFHTYLMTAVLLCGPASTPQPQRKRTDRPMMAPLIAKCLV